MGERKESGSTTLERRRLEIFEIRTAKRTGGWAVPPISSITTLHIHDEGCHGEAWEGKRAAALDRYGYSDSCADCYSVVESRTDHDRLDMPLSARYGRVGKEVQRRSRMTVEEWAGLLRRRTRWGSDNGDWIVWRRGMFVISSKKVA